MINDNSWVPMVPNWCQLVPAGTQPNNSAQEVSRFLMNTAEGKCSKKSHTLDGKRLSHYLRFYRGVASPTHPQNQGLSSSLPTWAAVSKKILFPFQELCCYDKATPSGHAHVGVWGGGAKPLPPDRRGGLGGGAALPNFGGRDISVFC